MEKKTALIVIDVQEGFNQESWGPSNNPDCEDNIRKLLDTWRSNEWPVVLVRHDSVSPNSSLRPGQPGNDFMPGIFGKHDLLVSKSVNSAFYGSPDLDAWLKNKGYKAIVICGITTNHCCETTARMAGNLGYDVTFVIDATRTFDFKDMEGQVIKADEMARVTATNLNGEFARVVTTKDVI
ncbi:MAG: cysteine hydrolase family protein [Candidatus Nanopelagicaceae bacterium]|nr:cysteine hydrolase family protein [Candidatus Nanopelagicaceae bacterium]